MKPRIWLSSPHIAEEGFKYIQDILHGNNNVPLNLNIDAFEKDICAYSGVSYAAALNSGTAAIHLALILLGVQSGDEVICSSFTFSASANPIIYQNATPVFVDSEPDTWNMSPEFLEQAIRDRIAKGKKPKAIILVHLYGQPAKLDELLNIAKIYDIPLIEDAAESLGSTYKGKMTGTFGFMGVYSFNGNKIITTSGGGALISEQGDLMEKAKFLATQARDTAPHYQHSQIGYNYRMSNVIAGIGRGQIEVVAYRIMKRRANFEFYQHAFKNIKEINFLPEYKDTFANRWLTCITIDRNSKVTREDIRLALEEENIESRPLWKPMHLQPVFESYPYYGAKVSEDLFERGLCLPSGSNLTKEDLERVVEKVIDLFK